MLRKRIISLILATALIFLAGISANAIPREPKYAPGQLIVRLKTDILTIALGDTGIVAGKADVRSDSFKALNDKHKVKKIDRLIKNAKKGPHQKKLKTGKIVTLPDMSNIFLLELPPDADIIKAAEDFRNDPNVEYAEPNYVNYKLAVTPNDRDYESGDPDHYPNQWALYKIGLGPVGSGESGWDIEQGTSTVTVAALDSGVLLAHQDLSGKAYSGYNFVTPTMDANDDDGHGTHVAGIIGAKTNNTFNIAGTDWNCRIMAVKVLDQNGSGYDSEIIDAIHFAADNDADIMNMSFGKYQYVQDMQDAITYATIEGVLMVAAAGNDEISLMMYPAAYDGVISVASTGPDDTKASYSNYGSWVDVAAPGGDTGGVFGATHAILSTFNNGISGEAWLMGTSMAAPYVCGVASLLKAHNPSWDRDQITEQLLKFVDNIDNINPRYAGAIGSGRINAFLALGGLHAYIASPSDGGTGYGVVEIKGTATGEGFDHYDVEYGVGTSPPSWVLLQTSSSTRLNEKLTDLDTTGTESYYTIKLTINDLPTTETKVTFKAGASHIPILLSSPQNGPNPFDPLSESTMIMYGLTSNADISIYIFDTIGTLLWKKTYMSGLEGGRQGTNRVFWDGKSHFGNTVQNGVYLYRVVSGTRVLGSGKIIVLK